MNGKFVLLAQLATFLAQIEAIIDALTGGDIKYTNAALNNGQETTVTAALNALFTDFVHAHPELRELWIPWNPGIKDLTPLLELEELQYVRVSADLKEAIASLDGKGIHFDFEIEGQ